MEDRESLPRDLLGELLGKRAPATSRETGLEVIQEIRRGLPFARVERVLERLGFSIDEASESLGMPRRTLYRRRAERQRLDASESEKVLRLTRVAATAADVLGDEERARLWLRTANRALGGVTPASLLDTDVGAEAVLDVLGRIEHGVYS